MVGIIDEKTRVVHAYLPARWKNVQCRSDIGYYDSGSKNNRNQFQ